MKKNINLYSHKSFLYKKLKDKKSENKIEVYIKFQKFQMKKMYFLIFFNSSAFIMIF